LRPIVFQHSFSGLPLRPKNGEWTTAAFFTKLPGGFTVSPQTPGNPETGHVRGILIKKNEPVGNPSPDYPVTVS